MKISAMPASAAGAPGTDLSSTHIGVTASAQKLAAAKAIAQGLEPPKEEEKPKDPIKEAFENARRIKMRTNYSTNRDDTQIAMPDLASANSELAKSDISTAPDVSGQTNAAVESTQPLSPQFAALAKQRRALQVKEREVAELLAKAKQPPEGDYIAKADLLANPLKIFEAGLTYDQLTEAILKEQGGITPEIQSLKEELKRVKEDVNKTLTERDNQAREQVLSEMKREAQGLVQTGDDYEMVREKGYLPQVIQLIDKTHLKTGEVLDVREALNLVETELLNDVLKDANIKKVRSKMAPEPVQTQPQSQGKQMRTLTNRDGASTIVDRRARAIAAMNGTLRK